MYFLLKASADFRQRHLEQDRSDPAGPFYERVCKFKKCFLKTKFLFFSHLWIPDLDIYNLASFEAKSVLASLGSLEVHPNKTLCLSLGAKY